MARGNEVREEGQEGLQREIIHSILESDKWTEGEKFIVKWQFRLIGHFRAALIDCIARADNDNLERLHRGFADEVDGFLAWSRGNLATRLRATGLLI